MRKITEKYLELRGEFADAIVYTTDLDPETVNQIKQLLDHEVTKGQRVRIMPDCHAGLGCVIGTTMTISDKVVPNLVGVDIGCGMLTLKLASGFVDLKQLDEFIREHIPSGFNVRERAHKNADMLELEKLNCAKHIDLNRAVLSIGTLGGGNHFIEMGKSSDGSHYLVIHTGSRHPGNQVAEYYQRKAVMNTTEKLKAEKRMELLALGERVNIQKMQDKLVQGISGKERQLMYLEGEIMESYLSDMQMMQQYAALNRKTIAEIIVAGMDLEIESSFETVHNYIDMETKMLRKGAISAKRGETVLIPLNMRDGSLICEGKGNPDWNYSAPHGAGRAMSRKVAREQLKLSEFESEMEGIYTTSVSKSTLDEAPGAYKTMDSIIGFIGQTVEIKDRIVPVYNFKSP